MKQPTKILYLLALSFLFNSTFAQSGSQKYLQEIRSFQNGLNQEFSDPNDSPLTEEDRTAFDSLPFFPIDQVYRVKASFVRTPDESSFGMETTTNRRPVYKKYGVATFTLDGESYELSVYQNLALAEKEEYEEYLFLPFKDHTNGSTSYGGGRFIDLEIPKKNRLVIDFNKAYNPYCAYNHQYSCPVPPKENHLEVAIPAGVMTPEGH